MRFFDLARSTPNSLLAAYAKHKSIANCFRGDASREKIFSINPSGFKSPVLQEALAVGRSNWLTIEDLVSFDVGGVAVFLRMDLAFRDREGRVVIVDWKTGRGEGRFSEVQLAGYALYAARQGWVGAAEEIQTELAYLAIPRYVRRSVDARKLEHARAFIEKSASGMKALLLDPLLNLGRLDDFPMIDRPQTCRRCNYRRLCFPPMVAATDAAQPASVAL